jgi:hypothetical protein
MPQRCASSAMASCAWLLRLALGSDKEDRASLGGEVRRKLFRLPKQLRGLPEIDDVDPVALAEDVWLHLRVPAFGLVSEVDPRLEQILQRNPRQIASITVC